MTMETSETTTTHYATCPLCEATCGLSIETRGREVVSVRGDEADVFSHGYLCPKANGLRELDADPDRLRQPMIREGDAWREVSWPEAFAAVEAGLMGVIERNGRNAVAVYLGNPNVHNLSMTTYLPGFLKSLKSQNVYSASTVDQQPKQIAIAMMFGDRLSLPVPDIDRTDYLLVLGANPLVSNGSLMTAPDMRGRLKKLRERGGKLVVIDPLRTLTAEKADEHYFIRPGGDAYLLFAMAHVLIAENLCAPGRLAAHAAGMETLVDLTRPFTPEAVAPVCGIAPEIIRRLAHELAAAPTAAVYGRIGTCTQEFGTLSSWLVDVLNYLTGNLDREGGVLFTRPAAGAPNTQGEPGRGRGFMQGRWHSRVRGLPETFGELPTVCLSEEMATPGEGQVRALITMAGNPVISTPDSSKLERAMENLDFMVSVDIYMNETTRHANVILPGLSPLEHAHYDLTFYQMSVRNIAHYSPPVFERTDGGQDDWEIMLTLTGIVAGAGTATPTDVLDDMTLDGTIARAIKTVGSPVYGRDPATVRVALGDQRGPDRLLDLALRTGPYGDGFGVVPDGLTLERVAAQPHGMDLGPLASRIPEVLRTPSGKIELAPPLIVGDVERLRAGLWRRSDPDTLLLIGRRGLRSNNSWMHNLPSLVKGKDVCTLLINPVDAERCGLSDGALATVASDAGEVCLPAEITAAIAPGVVSIPHGWGHNRRGARLGVAAEHAGVNANILNSTALFDHISGNAVLNGAPVRVEKASVPVAHA